MSALQHQEGGAHYKNCAIQPVEFIHANGLGFCEGNVVKYVARWRSKNGLEDLKKARHYLDLLIEMEEKQQAAKKPALVQESIDQQMQRVRQQIRAEAERPPFPPVNLGRGG